MNEIPERLQNALAASCAEDLSQIILAHREEDFHQLRQILAAGPGADPLLRLRVLYALGRWGDPRAVDDILQVMPRLDEPGRVAAFDALGRLESVQALPALLDHAASPSLHVRKFVIHALGRLNLPEARQKLRVISDTDPEPTLRQLARGYLDRTN